jgi:hypothetical protein
LLCLVRGVEEPAADSASFAKKLEALHFIMSQRKDVDGSTYGGALIPNLDAALPSILLLVCSFVMRFSFSMFYIPTEK